MNLQRKLQVFISSTYLDLREERQAAVEAVLQAGHLPAGMELFTAGDESQLETILRWIDQSDVLLLVLGERYGSVEPKSGKSYIQLEYEYALSKNKKVFALVLADEWIRKKYQALGKDATDSRRVEHAEFKRAVLSRICREIVDLKDIHIEVTRSLNTYASDPTLAGWIRASDYAKSQALISELQITITELRARSASSVPSLAEMHDEFKRCIEELRSMRFDCDISVRNYRLNEYHTYHMEGDGLSLLKDCIRYLTEEPPHYLSEAVDFFDSELVPLLNVWGITKPSTTSPDLTSKGKLFVSFIEKNVFEGCEDLILDKVY